MRIRYRPVLVVLIPAVMFAVVMLVTAHALEVTNEQRRASCDATLTALRGVRETSAAGIRPEIPTAIVNGYPESIREGALRQRAATVAENARRRAVVNQMNQAIVHLASSDFCQ